MKKAVWLHTQDGDLLRIKKIVSLELAQHSGDLYQLKALVQVRPLPVFVVAELALKEYLNCLRILLVDAFNRNRSTTIIYVADLIKEIEEANAKEEAELPSVRCTQCGYIASLSIETAIAAGWGWNGVKFFCTECQAKHVSTKEEK